MGDAVAVAGGCVGLLEAGDVGGVGFLGLILGVGGGGVEGGGGWGGGGAPD